MGNSFQQSIYNPVTPSYHTNLVATGAEIPTLAGKRHKIIFPALIAVYAAKPVLQQTTIQILSDSFLNDWTQCSITIFIPPFIFTAKRIKMVFDKLVKRGCSRIAWPINSSLHAFL
jgi:hypothetical protein